MKRTICLIIPVVFFVVCCGKDKIPIGFGDNFIRDRPVKIERVGENNLLPRIEINKVNRSQVGFDSVNTSINLTEEVESNILDGIDRNKYLRDKILNLTYRKMLQQEPTEKELISENDDDIHFLSNWKDQHYFVIDKKINDLVNRNDLIDNTGHYGFNFQLSLMNLQAIDAIKNLNLTFYNYNSSGQESRKIDQQILFNQHDEEAVFNTLGRVRHFSTDSFILSGESLRSQALYDGIKDRSNIIMQLNDYTIVAQNGEELSYLRLKRQLKREKAKVIFSTPRETKVFYVNQGTQLRSFLEVEFDRFEIDEEGKIVSINGHKNSVDDVVNWNNPLVDQFDQGFWTIIGSGDREFFKDRTYIISYATVAEVLGTNRNQRILLANQLVEDRVEVSNINVGDIITMEFNAANLIPQYSTERRNEECGYEIQVEVPDPQPRYTPKGPYDFHPKRDPGSIRTEVLWGQNCEIVHKSFTGYTREEIDFRNGIENLRLRVEINGKQYLLNDLLLTNQRPAIFADGKTLKVRLLIKKEHLNDQKTLIIKVIADPKSEDVSIGFQGWGNCDVRNRPGFRFRSYSTVSSTHNNAILEKYQVSLSAASLLR